MCHTCKFPIPKFTSALHEGLRQTETHLKQPFSDG